MSELLPIQEYLSKKGFSYIVPRVLNPELSALALEVPRGRVGDKASKEKTSRRQLAFITRSLEKEFGKRVFVVFRDSPDLDDIAISLRAVLRHGFPDLITDVHVSFETSTSAVVWVEPKAAIDSDEEERLEEETRSELARFGVTCQAFGIVTTQRPEPSIAAILRAVKVHAPASLAMLSRDLLQRGFFSPSEEWLSRKLDVARKRGLVLRGKDGRFVLTASGLEVVPWSRTASSSDVDRMLSLARRKQW